MPKEATEAAPSLEGNNYLVLLRYSVIIFKRIAEAMKMIAEGKYENDEEIED